MKGMIDLHTHSNYSDSSVQPAELVRQAREIDLSAIALTDHDTVDGLKEALSEGKRLGIEVIPGIEISTNVDECDIHIVGLLINPEDETLRGKLKNLADRRANRNVEMVKKLEKAGFDIHVSDLDSFAGRQISRAHIAQLLVERGYAPNIREAMLKYTTKGTVGYVKRQTPSVEECIEMIHQAGGLAFAAHLNQIDRNDREHGICVFRQIADAGIDGLETLYSEYDDYWNETAEVLAREYGLLRSGGSDYHGSYKPGLSLGTGYGALRVPAEYLAAMKEKLRV